MKNAALAALMEQEPAKAMEIAPGMTVEEMIAKAAEEYEVAADEIRQGVFDWLSDFEKKGYIIRSE